MHHHKYRLIIPFLLPALLLYGLFVLWPYAQAIYVSLTGWRGVSDNKPWVGLDNYQRLWDDDRFHEALARNGQLLIVLPLVTILIALTFAALFTQGSQRSGAPASIGSSSSFRKSSPPSSSAFSGATSTPRTSACSTASCARSDSGTVSASWLADPDTVFWAIAAVAVWSSVGFYMVIFLASMQSIPTSFYEAAILDGASSLDARSRTSPSR